MRKDVLQLQTPIKQPLPLGGLMLLHLHPGKLSTRIQFTVALHLAAKILLGAFIIDRFIYKIFPVERKAVPWHLQIVAITEYERTLLDTCISNTVLHSQKHAIDLNVYHDAVYSSTKVAEEIMQKWNTQHSTLVKTTSHGLFTIVPGEMLKHGHCTLAARGIIEISPKRLFVFLSTIFSNWWVCIPKRAVIAK